MTGLDLPLADLATLRAKLRANAGAWIARLYRHELLVSRTVVGMQVEAQQEFDRIVVQPLLREIGGRLASFDLRGPDVVFELVPELRALEAEMRAIVHRGTDAVRRMTTERLHDLTKQEAEWTRDTTEKVLGVRAPSVSDSIVQQRTEQRPFLGQRTEKWFKDMLEGPTGDRTRAWVQTGIQRNLSTDEIVRGLRGTKKARFKDGILSSKPRHAVATLVRTAATHASSIARMESFKEIGVEQWRWLDTLDTSTCVVCATNAKESPYNMGEGPQFPAHPHCRCSPVPWFGDPIGTRASVDGQVPADTDLESWASARSHKEQNEVFGVAKAKAWRAGRLSMKDMIGPDQQPLTLEQLRELDRL